MNKGFWDTYIPDYIINLSEKYIDSKEYGIIILPEGYHFSDLGFHKQDPKISAFFEPLFQDINDIGKWYKETFSLPDISNIKGFLVFEIESMKRKLVMQSSYSVIAKDYSLMNDIKYLIIHECRHAQQNLLLRNEIKDSRTIYNLISLDKEKFNVIEYDAVTYALSKTTTLYQQIDFDKAFLSCINDLYFKD